MVGTLNQTIRAIPTWPFYEAALAYMPLAFWWAWSGQLGADPVKALEHMSGLLALQFLLGSLAVTPLFQMTGINLVKFRRMLGLMAFAYALAHLTVFVELDLQLIPSLLKTELTKRPYILMGFLGLLVMAPLAWTSRDKAIRKMGPKRWRALHKLAYVAAAAGAIHFIWSVKEWPLEPVAYLALTALLLGWRLVRFVRMRMQKQGLARA